MEVTRQQRAFRSRKRSCAIVITTLGVLLGLIACGNENEVISAGTEGSNERIGDVKILNLLVAAPPDGRYRTGDTAIARVTIVNESEQVQQVSLASSAADRVLIHRGSACPVTADGAVSMPVPPAVDAPSRNVPPGADAYWLEFVGLRSPVLAGASLPVTFQLEPAGTVTFDAMVQSTGTDRPELLPAEVCPNHAR